MSKLYRENFELKVSQRQDQDEKKTNPPDFFGWFSVVMHGEFFSFRVVFFLLGFPDFLEFFLPQNPRQCGPHPAEIEGTQQVICLIFFFQKKWNQHEHKVIFLAERKAGATAEDGRICHLFSASLKAAGNERTFFFSCSLDVPVC